MTPEQMAEMERARLLAQLQGLPAPMMSMSATPMGMGAGMGAGMGMAPAPMPMPMPMPMQYQQQGLLMDPTLMGQLDILSRPYEQPTMPNLMGTGLLDYVANPQKLSIPDWRGMADKIRAQYEAEDAAARAAKAAREAAANAAAQSSGGDFGSSGGNNGVYDMGFGSQVSYDYSLDPLSVESQNRDLVNAGWDPIGYDDGGSSYSGSNDLSYDAGGHV